MSSSFKHLQSLSHSFASLLMCNVNKGKRKNRKGNRKRSSKRAASESLKENIGKTYSSPLPIIPMIGTVRDEQQQLIK